MLDGVRPIHFFLSNTQYGIVYLFSIILIRKIENCVVW